MLYNYDAIGSKERVISGANGVGDKVGQVYLDGVVTKAVGETLAKQISGKGMKREEGVGGGRKNNNNNHHRALDPYLVPDPDLAPDLDPLPPGYPHTTNLPSHVLKEDAVRSLITAYKKVGGKESGLGYGKGRLKKGGGEAGGGGGQIVVWVLDKEGVEKRLYNV